jgi:hypothetical protein
MTARGSVLFPTFRATMTAALGLALALGGAWMARSAAAVVNRSSTSRVGRPVRCASSPASRRASSARGESSPCWSSGSPTTNP